MSLSESVEYMREYYETEMDQGRLRKSPRAVSRETDKLTSVILQKITKKDARKKDRQVGLEYIFAASVVEGQLINQLKKK